MNLNRNQLLALSVCFTLLLLSVRAAFSGTFMYGFLAWNLVLAAVPIYISNRLLIEKNSFLQILLFAGWLVFFPNAFYIPTDLVHLEPRAGIPFWMDIILVFSAAINGLLLGFCSLFEAEKFLLSKFEKRGTFRLMILVIFLTSWGIYIGRFLRWNTWDILLHPFGLSLELLNHIFDPFSHTRTWGMTILLTVFFTLFYFTVKTISNEPGGHEKVAGKRQF